MEAIVLDWLNLMLRWTHIIVAIAWIGSSFYFMWLDSHLEAPAEPSDEIEGQLWMVHSGGFYQVNKIMVAPKVMPRTLHWFKWEAAWTGITGIGLLAVVFYLGSEAFLIDPQVSEITKLQAVGIGAGTLVVGWLLYDTLYMSNWSNENGALAAAVSFAGLCGVAFGLSQILSGRGAYVHVGALMGIVMVLNVWIRILPGQQNLVNARKAGKEPDPAYGVLAKQRSVHNNYMTLPIVFVMISSHYPETYGHAQNWAVLIALFIIGALVRHWFNLRNSGSSAIWPVPVAIVAMASLAAWVSGPQVAAKIEAANAPPVPFAKIELLVRTRCSACHTAKPVQEGFETPPKNIKFDTPEEIHKHAAMIKRTAVLTSTMPLGNITRMTPEERKLLGLWIDQGMKLD
ncbi:MAG: urate hydroxylase PuuD [Proteobacteria bacterium]|nr:urate hydroxylase PuuD [Pseudomonadota bacterium]